MILRSSIIQYRFIPFRAQPVIRSLGTIQMTNIHLPKTIEIHPSTSPISSPIQATNVISLQKLYSVDLDIQVRWIVASIEKRIFLCDTEGDMRIFSYSRRLHRQPLLTERFRVSLKRLITSFTVTHDYVVTFESDTRVLALHTHHGALLVRLEFPFEPLMMIRGDFQRQNSIWVCSEHQRQCYQFGLNHAHKQMQTLDQIDFSRPIAHVLIDPVGISCDENNRVGIHDVAVTASDRLLLFDDNQSRIIPLDSIKDDDDRVLSSRLERIFLVPKQRHLIIVISTAQYSTGSSTEILLVHIQSAVPRILWRLIEPNGVQDLDCTMNGEFIYITRGSTSRRLLPKMHVYRFTDE